LLHRREEHLQDLFHAARSEITKLSEDEARYSQFLESVILQGLLQLLEASVTIHARSRDMEIVKGAVEGASKQYTEISGREVEVDVEGSLSDDMYVS
jgi:V-type H+-transporting ATPase subunit E